MRESKREIRQYIWGWDRIISGMAGSATDALQLEELPLSKVAELYIRQLST